METRLYFIAGDVLANAGAGAGAVVVCTALLGETWPPAAMILGMIIGGAVAMLLGMLASLLFGAFEVMLPVMTTGMLAGMMASMQAVPVNVAATRGAVAGIGILVVTYLLNARLRRETGPWTR